MHIDFLVENVKGRGGKGRIRPTWEDNVKVDFKEMECECVDWIHLARDRSKW